MRFLTLTTLGLALGTPAIAAVTTMGGTFVAKDFYLKDVAPTQLQRISDYANEHENAMTAAQASFLSKAKAAVSAFDVSSFEALRGEAGQLFSAEDAKYILTGEMATSKAPRDEGSLLHQQTSCSCSTESDWCGNNTACRAGEGGCNQTGGCGTFDAYLCDGRCVNP